MQLRTVKVWSSLLSPLPHQNLMLHTMLQYSSASISPMTSSTPLSNLRSALDTKERETESVCMCMPQERGSMPMPNLNMTCCGYDEELKVKSQIKSSCFMASWLECCTYQSSASLNNGQPRCICDSCRRAWRIWRFCSCLLEPDLKMNQGQARVMTPIHLIPGGFGETKQFRSQDTRPISMPMNCWRLPF